MTRLVATFQTVTPIYMGGGVPQKAVNRLRPPSFKGALRFWWRALQWSPAIRRTGGDVAAALRALRTDEAALFGHASSGDRGHQSRVRVRIADENLRPVGLPSDPGIAYCLGQDWKDRHEKGLRGSFSAILDLHRSLTSQQTETLYDAVMILGLLGGLGARTRHGIGSLSLRQIEDWSAPTTLAEYRNRIADRLANLTKVRPPYTAFWKGARIEVAVRGDNAADMLSELGNGLKRHRKETYPDDVTRIREVVNRRTPDRPPSSLAFGLPHNYHFIADDGSPERNVSVKPFGKERDRRATPLLLHVHELPDPQAGRFLAVHSHFPTPFLPLDTKLCMTLDKPKFDTAIEPHHDRDVIPTYLDTFTDRVRIL